MAENLLPEIIPGMVAVEFTGSDNKETGERNGAMKNVFPIDAKELVATGKYKLVDNGAVEAARINANPMRSGRAPQADVVVSEVTGIGGEVHVAATPELAEQARAAGDSGEDVPAKSFAAPQPAKTDAKPLADVKTDAAKK